MNDRMIQGPRGEYFSMEGTPSEGEALNALMNPGPISLVRVVHGRTYPEDCSGGEACGCRRDLLTEDLAPRLIHGAPVVVNALSGATVSADTRLLRSTDRFLRDVYGSQAPRTRERFRAAVW